MYPYGIYTVTYISIYLANIGKVTPTHGTRDVLFLFLFLFLFFFFFFFLLLFLFLPAGADPFGAI